MQLLQLEVMHKLRTYSQFKHELGTEPYVTIITRKCYRSAYAKLRCGVVPIKIETCRYGLNRVPVEQRLCDELRMNSMYLWYAPDILVFAPMLRRLYLILIINSQLTHHMHNLFK